MLSFEALIVSLQHCWMNHIVLSNHKHQLKFLLWRRTYLNFEKTGAQDQSAPVVRQYSFPSLLKWIPKSWARQHRMIEELFIRQFHMKFQYHSELGVKLLLIQCSYKKDLALYLIDPPSSPRGRRDRVEGLFSYLTPSIKLHTFHVSAFFKSLCLRSHIFHHSSSFFVLPFQWAPGWKGHSAKEWASREGCPGMVINIGWATQGSVRDVCPCWSPPWGTELTGNCLSFSQRSSVPTWEQQWLTCCLW